MNTISSEMTLDSKKYYLEWVPGESYTGLKNITQAYGFCFNRDGRLLVQRRSFGPWQVMGGSIEPGETPEETLVREVAEEVNVEIENIKYIGTQKVTDENGRDINQLRFAAFITKLNRRKPDPAKGVIRPRKFIDPDRYAEVSGWGEMGTDMVNRAKKKLNLA